MRFKRLDMNLLAALDVLLRVANVSKAADEMFITQSAMSNALGRLRTFFDDPLLVQVGRKMELTPFAESLQDPLRQIMLQIETTVLTSPDFDPKSSTREFSIILSDYSMAIFGGALIRRLAVEAPEITLNLRPQIAAPERLLQRGEADLLILPEYLAQDAPATEPLFEDRLSLIVCAQGRYRDGVDYDAFQSGAHVVMEPFSGQESFASHVTRQAGLSRRKAVSTYAFTAIPDLLRGTDRIGLLQERLALRVAAGGAFRVHPPPVELPPLRQVVQWHEHRSRDPGLIWLREQLHAVVNLPPDTPL